MPSCLPFPALCLGSLAPGLEAPRSGGAAVEGARCLSAELSRDFSEWPWVEG